jgi:glycosyltransferase involved in cell wall biosynthesis
MSDELLQADVVLVHNMPWLGQRLRTALPQKQIWLYVHNPIMRRVPSWSKRIAFGFFDGIINISEYMDQSFRKYFDAHQRLIVQNAYAGQVVSPYKDREIDVLFVGRMTPEKGVDVLLNALQRLDTSELRIVFIGSASNENDRPSRYSKNLNQRILDGQYESLGRMSRPETQLMVGQAKLLVVPSVWDEPFGLTLLEGFAGGACVVASAVGAIPAIVGNGGVLFPRSDAESLAQVIESLLSNQEERKMIAVVGQARLNHYSWAGSVEALTNRFG